LSLIELLISLSIFFIILLAIYLVFESSQSTYSSGTRKQDAQQQARMAMDEMVRQVRMTGYYPEQFDANAGNDLVNPLSVHIATPTALAIFGDLDGGGTSRVFLFCSSNGSLLANAGGASGAAGSYSCSCTGAQTGCVLADNITSVRFRYYDAANNEIVGNGAQGQLDGKSVGAAPTLNTGADRAQRGIVQRVVVTLQITEAVGLNQPSQLYNLTSSIQFRNPNTN
jgi:type II secretory pathway pseudopilin PulG